MAFAKTRPDLRRPDIQLHFMPLIYGTIDTTLPTRMGMPVCSGITISVTLCKPQGRGRVVLNDMLRPKVLHQAMGNVDDVRTLIDGLKLVDRLYDAPALAGIVTGRLAPAMHPENDAQWLDHLTCNPEYHVARGRNLPHGFGTGRCRGPRHCACTACAACAWPTPR